MKRILVVMLLALAPSVFAASNPLTVHLGGTDFILPLQKTSVTQLYSFKDKKGYPGLETIVCGWVLTSKVNGGSVLTPPLYRYQLTAGAAPVLGTSNNVPFMGLQTILPERFFDTTDNGLLFGVWAGKESHAKNWTYGVKASVALW